MTINDDLTYINDIDLLKFHLKCQREQLTRKLNQFIQLDLAYKDFLNRHDYEQLKNQYDLLEQQTTHLRNEYQHLGHACLYLINKTHDLIEERNFYANQWKKHRVCLTPRPDWQKVENIIDGRRERWTSLATGRSSDELMNILIEEIPNGNERNSTNEPECFSGLGDDSSVLPFLRTMKYTKIINRKMQRRITGILINEIWTEKICEPNRQRQTLAEYVANYMEKRFDSKPIAIEIGYNLRDACQRYRNSRQINLFWGILTGQIEEMVYHHQMKSICQLFQHFIQMKNYFSRKNSSSENVEARRAIVNSPHSPQSTLSFQFYPEISTDNNYFLTDEQFIQSLKLLYPDKTQLQIDQLFHSAKIDVQSVDPTIDFSLLFLEDTDGQYDEFLSVFVQQLADEKLAYIEQIKQILLGLPLVTVSQFCRAIDMIDPTIPSNELQRYVQWIFQSNESKQTIDFEDLLRRLENCACFKHYTKK